MMARTPSSTEVEVLFGAVTAYVLAVALGLGVLWALWRSFVTVCPLPPA